ncbi:hypothetical protein Q3G72_003498 [Acer saccharum]|nr:hypothetical protein Q3G72_003498 [Acer saccharum]
MKESSKTSAEKSRNVSYFPLDGHEDLAFGKSKMMAVVCGAEDLSSIPDSQLSENHLQVSQFNNQQSKTVKLLL